MKNSHFLYWLNYVFFIAPPRSLSIKHKADSVEGELKGKSIFTVTLIELLLRTSLFLILASTLEFFLGETIYESLRFDAWFLALIVFGAAHSVLFIVCCHFSFEKRLTRTLYRLGRNCFYACICGVATMLATNALEIFRLIPPIPHAELGKVLWISISVFGIAGAIEAFTAKRLPLATESAAMLSNK